MLETSQTHRDLYTTMQGYCTSNLIPDPRFQHLKYCLGQCTVRGQYLEFGVFRGYSVNYIAEQLPDQTIYGFDSFYGLPEDWLWLPQGEFSTGGQLPNVRNNVKLIPGMFHETLPKFELSTIAFVHIDCDLYSSTKYVLDTIETFIVPGTVIAFDDFPYFPGSEQHEYRAFAEFIDRTQKTYRVLAAVSSTPYLSIIFT